MAAGKAFYIISEIPFSFISSFIKIAFAYGNIMMIIADIYGFFT